MAVSISGFESYIGRARSVPFKVKLYPGEMVARRVAIHWDHWLNVWGCDWTVALNMAKEMLMTYRSGARRPADQSMSGVSESFMWAGTGLKQKQETAFTCGEAARGKGLGTELVYTPDC